MQLKDVSYANKVVAEKVLSFELEKEMIWFKSYLETIESPIVLSHNDIYTGNMLIRKDTDELVFLDFEYSCLCWRGFDIGMYFVERSFDHTHNGYLATFNLNEYPNEQQRRHFVTEYVEEAASIIGESYKLDPINSVDHILMEASKYQLGELLRIIGWCIIEVESDTKNMKKNNSNFDFWVSAKHFLSFISANHMLVGPPGTWH